MSFPASLMMSVTLGIGTSVKLPCSFSTSPDLSETIAWIDWP